MGIGVSVGGGGGSLDTLAVDAIADQSAQDALPAALQGVASDVLPLWLDNKGSALTTGHKLDYYVPWDCKITGWQLMADQSGSIVLDVWRQTYASYPATVTQTITGNQKPTLSTAIKAQNLAVTAWDQFCSAGDMLRVNVDSITTVTRVLLTLFVERLP